MMNRKQKKDYIALEKNLEHKFRSVRENELTLTKEDFKDGRLKSSSFNRLKDECWYIGYEDEVEIRVPEEYADGFKDGLEFLAARKLSKIKKDRREDIMHAIILLFTGLAVLGALALLFAFWEAMETARETFFVGELLTIASWVFVWAAVTKFFIDRRDLRDQRFTLLQLLSARIILTEENESGGN